MIVKNIKKAIEIMQEPKKFFKQVHHEKELKYQVHFLTILAMVIFIFLTYYYLEQINLMLGKVNAVLGYEAYSRIELSFGVYLGLYLALTISFILISFLRYWVTHWFVILLKGKHNYQQTYKAMVYSLAPEYIYAPLFTAVVLLLPFTVARNSIILWIIWGVLLILYLIPSIYEIYLRIIALSILQKISYMRSFLAIFIFGYLAQIILLFIVTLVLMLIFYIALILIF